MSIFETTETIFKNIVLSFTETQWFSSEEYINSKRIAKDVFAALEPGVKIFIGIVCGTNKGYELGHPELDEGLCFSARFLKKKSTELLSDNLKALTKSIAEKTLYLGLFHHLISTQFPTRSEVKVVDVQKLLHDWSLYALVADNLLKDTAQQQSKLTLPLFEHHYRLNIEPGLKKEFKLRFWTVDKCKSFFKNLFYAGILLGRRFDLMTKEYSPRTV
jgi:hypothetical protein